METMKAYNLGENGFILVNNDTYIFQSFAKTICKIDRKKETIVFDKEIVDYDRCIPMEDLYIFLQRFYDIGYKWNLNKLMKFIGVPLLDEVWYTEIYNPTMIKNLNK